MAGYIRRLLWEWFIQTSADAANSSFAPLNLSHLFDIVLPACPRISGFRGAVLQFSLRQYCSNLIMKRDGIIPVQLSKSL